MANRTLEQVLASTSDVLFPDECGEKNVTVESRASDGDSALHVLARRDDVEGARLLIAAGADVNARGDMGCTPLHVAVEQNNVALATILINAGARSDVGWELGGTAREKAQQVGGELATLLSTAINPITPPTPEAPENNP
jgi:ankyrin repeat protein